MTLDCQQAGVHSFIQYLRTSSLPQWYFMAPQTILNILIFRPMRMLECRVNKLRFEKNFTYGSPGLNRSMVNHVLGSRLYHKAKATNLSLSFHFSVDVHQVWKNHWFMEWLYNEKAWTCDLNGITQRGRLADGYIIASAKREWSCIHTPIPELCNAIQITGQMPSRFISYLYMTI